MITTKKVMVKSIEDIKSYFTEFNNDDNEGLYNKKQLIVSKYLWDICGTEIEVIDQKLRTHDFDMAHLYYGIYQKTNSLHYIYLMNEWIEQN